jgi:hemolysin activation/secretion protein
LGVQSISRISEGHTPVRYFSLLGGTEIMRGYYKGRYAGKDMIAFQAEIRQYLFWRLGVVGFASAGQVSNSIKDFGTNDFHYSFGGGIRLMVNEKEKLNLRIDYGFAKQNHGVYVILKEAF